MGRTAAWRWWVVAPLLMAACSLQQHTDTRDLGEGAALSLTLQPFPLTVGASSELYATLRLQRSAGTGCKIQYRQSPADLAANGDIPFIEIPEQARSGIYKTRTSEFSAEGLWRFEFQIDCGEVFKRRSVVFEYMVKL